MILTRLSRYCSKTLLRSGHIPREDLPRMRTLSGNALLDVGAVVGDEFEQLMVDNELHRDSQKKSSS